MANDNQPPNELPSNPDDKSQQESESGWSTFWLLEAIVTSFEVLFAAVRLVVLAIAGVLSSCS